jgi:hypothetical protein
LGDILRHQGLLHKAINKIKYKMKEELLPEIEKLDKNKNK